MTLTMIFIVIMQSTGKSLSDGSLFNFAWSFSGLLVKLKILRKKSLWYDLFILFYLFRLLKLKVEWIMWLT